MQNDDTRKLILFQNLQRLLDSTLMSTEKPRFCRFEERNSIKFSMPAVISVSQYQHHLIQFQKRNPSFAISTEAKHGLKFVVAFSVFGSVICGTAVSCF